MRWSDDGIDPAAVVGARVQLALYCLTCAVATSPAWCALLRAAWRLTWGG